MSKFSVTVDLGELQGISGIVNQQVLPLLSQAVRGVAQQLAINWQEEVLRAKLWSKEKDAYIKSIKWKMTGDFSAEVSTDYKYAQEIDDGRPARDLKRMLNTSMKVRTTKKGERYLIIPFRHGDPDSGAYSKPMPAEVHDQAKQLSASRIIGQGRRVSGTGAFGLKSRQPITVNQSRYKWGERLIGEALGKRYSNMVRFDTDSGKSKSSAYLTFRVMRESSKGWIIPPAPGLRIVEKLVKQMQPLAETAFAGAIKRTTG